MADEKKPPTDLATLHADPLYLSALANLDDGRQAPARPDPSKCSIAVLPFANMSADPEQEYFADGLSEDLITTISRFRHLLVIARNSAFTYKGRAVKMETIRRELGVDFVVEGSVRKAGDRIRVTAQLVDTSTGSHIWANRYDRQLDDIFAVQDELVREITAITEKRVYATVVERARSKPASSAAAYELVLRARKAMETYNYSVAEPLLRTAIASDPEFAVAYGHLSHVCWARYSDLLSSHDIEEAVRLARTAVNLDESDPQCLTCLAFVSAYAGDFAAADIHSGHAHELNPGDAMVLNVRSHLLCRLGRPREAAPILTEVFRLDPFPPSFVWENAGILHIMGGKYDDALAAFQRMNAMAWWDWGFIAVSHAHAGRLDQARAAIEELLRHRSGMTISRFMITEPYRNPADAERIVSGLRQAGLPE